MNNKENSGDFVLKIVLILIKVYGILKGRYGNCVFLNC